MWDKIEHYITEIWNWFVGSFVHLALVFGYFMFCFEVEEYFFGELSGISLLLGVYFYYIYDKKKQEENEWKMQWQKDKILEKLNNCGMLKTETDREILAYINEKASEMNITSEEYIRKVKAYEEYQKNNIDK